MTKPKIKRPNRAERALRVMRRQWCSSMDIIRHANTTTPSRVLYEVRGLPGVVVKMRRVDGLYQYRAVVS